MPRRSRARVADAAITVPSVTIPQCEPLEDRRLFAAASPMMTTMLPSIVSGSGGTVHAAGATVHYTKIKGTYSGTYTKNGHTYTFTVKSTQFTHTGHFSGTVTIG